MYSFKPVHLTVEKGCLRSLCLLLDWQGLRIFLVEGTVEIPAKPTP